MSVLMMEGGGGVSFLMIEYWGEVSVMMEGGEGCQFL